MKISLFHSYFWMTFSLSNSRVEFFFFLEDFIFSSGLHYFWWEINSHSSFSSVCNTFFFQSGLIKGWLLLLLLCVRLTVDTGELLSSPGPELVFGNYCSSKPQGWGSFSIPALSIAEMDLCFVPLAGPGPSRFPDSPPEKMANFLISDMI